jgi:hypothetical protein
MTDFNQDLAISKILSLMNSYSFDTNQRNTEELIKEWLNNYDVNWIYLATIEALYLGRYKAVSIEQIMYGWSRKGHPTTHFGGDFERVICRKLPRHLNALNSLEEYEDNIKQLPEENDCHSNFTYSANLPISTQVTPFPPTQKKAQLFKKEHSQGIERFQPLPDASSFFQKLKALADNQRGMRNEE